MATKKIGWLVPLVCLAACSNGSNHEQYAKADSSATAAAAAPAQALPLNSPERKIIHTADFNCKVQNVMTAVNGLEHMVTAAGGIIEESKLDNSRGETNTIYYKPDSLQQLTTYTTTATLTLKIPAAALDSVIHSIPAMVSFIDSRTIKQTDVTARYMGNNTLLQPNAGAYTKESAVKLAKKTDDIIKAQQYEDETTQQMVERKVRQMQLQDDITYATLTVALSQPQQVYSQIIINTDHIGSVPFTTRMGLALQTGFNGLKELILCFANIWPLVLLAIAALVVFKKAKRRPLFPKNA